MYRVQSPFPVFPGLTQSQDGQIINNIDLGGGIYYRVHQFTTAGSQTFTTPSAVTSLEVFVLGGGGGGNYGQPSQWYPSGGAGSVATTDNNYAATGGQVISVVVGAGGIWDYDHLAGTNGGNSTFGTLTSIGGEAPLTSNTRTGGKNTLYIGGTNTTDLNAGGGAGAGGNGSSRDGGVGGGTSITGTSIRYGGGGASAGRNNTDGTAVDGGGRLFTGVIPTPNRGGGGAGNQGGGSGWVVVRYRITSLT